MGCILKIKSTQFTCKLFLYCLSLGFHRESGVDGPSGTSGHVCK